MHRAVQAHQNQGVSDDAAQNCAGLLFRRRKAFFFYLNWSQQICRQRIRFQSLSCFSKPSGISTAARIPFSTTLSLQSSVVRITLILGFCCSAATTPGESVPPTIITFGFSFLALPITADITAVKPVPMTGITNRGTKNVVMSVRLSRSASVNSLQYTIPILRRLMSDRLLRAVVWRDNFHENLLQIIFSMPLPQLLQRSLGQ